MLWFSLVIGRSTSRQLATSSENLVASAPFLVALATSESQFRALCCCLFVCLPVYLFMLSFLQEKMKGKNKLVPRLLGVTKESILRVDEKTKEVCIHTITC